MKQIILGILLIVKVSEIQANESYLRLGFGVDHPRTAYFINEKGQNTLYGTNQYSVGNFGNLPVVEFGIGNEIDQTRLELLLEWRPSYRFSGNSNFLGDGRPEIASTKNISSVSAMIAGYVDFNKGDIVPFIGIGVGITRNRLNGFQIKFPTTTTVVPEASKTNKAWMIATGIGYKLDEKRTLEFSLRYTDLGRINTGSNGKVVFDMGDRDDIPLTHVPTYAEFKSYGVRVSLRIKI